MALGCKFSIAIKNLKVTLWARDYDECRWLDRAKRILGDIRGVVSNPPKGASNKYKVQVTGH